MVTTQLKRLAWLLPLLLISQLSWAKAEARLDRTVIATNETVGLTISIDDTSIFGSPDIDILNKNFEVLGSNKSSKTSWVNGKKSALTEWRYEIAPKAAGMFTIPAIEVSGQQTQPLTLQVRAASKMPAATGETVFIEVSADRDSAYVQQQILLTIRINSAVQLQDLQLEELKLGNDLLQQEISNSNYRRNIQGTPYITHELVIALFPQASGELTIPAINALAVAPQASNRRQDVFGRMFNQGKQYRLRSQPITIDIREIPAAGQTQAWLPASQLRLSESWSADPENIQLGDSITRTITATAAGLTAEQLPPIIIQADSNFKTYPDQAKLNNEKSTDGIIGSRLDSIALVATRPGRITLPEVTVQWWDINSDSLQTATLPATTITVKGEMPQTSAPAVPTQPQQSTAAITQAPVQVETVTVTDSAAVRLWQLISLLLAIGMTVFALLWWRQRSQPAAEKPVMEQKVDTAQLLKHLQIACQNQNPGGIRTALLNWAKQHWPEQRINSTMDIARLYGSKTFDDYMQKLDAALYTGTQHQDWQGLYQLIEAREQQAEKNRDGLKPLYPSN